MRDKFICNDGIRTVTIKFMRHGYPCSGDWNEDDSIYDEALDNENLEDCDNRETNIESVIVEHSTEFNSEHITTSLGRC
jgi:hypothetical protein